MAVDRRQPDTFTGHITHLAAMDRSLQTPALVLIGEIDRAKPIEGGALGVAIVDHFRSGRDGGGQNDYDALKTTHRR